MDGVVRALQLDDAEQAHLRDLLQSTDKTPVVRDEEVRPEVKRIIDAMTGMPAMVRYGRLDVLYANPLGYALYSEMFRSQTRPVNPARFMFLDQSSVDFSADWEKAAYDMVALLRAGRGRNHSDQALSDLVDELSAKSPDSASCGMTTKSSFIEPVLVAFTLSLVISL